jgi:hypothetical protein
MQAVNNKLGPLSGKIDELDKRINNIIDRDTKNDEVREIEQLVIQYDQLSQRMSEIIQLGSLDKSEDK